MGDDMAWEAIVFDMHQAVLPTAVKRILWTTLNTVVFFQVQEKLRNISLNHVVAVVVIEPPARVNMVVRFQDGDRPWAAIVNVIRASRGIAQGCDVR